MSKNFLARNKNLLIFFAMIALLVIGERVLNRPSSVASGPISETEDPAGRPADGVTAEQNALDPISARVQLEEAISVAEDQFNATTLKEMEKGISAEAVQGANSAAPGGVTFSAHSSSKLLGFGEQLLGVVEVKLVPQESDEQGAGAQTAQAGEIGNLLRVYGFVNGKLISVSCARRSGRPVSLLSGACAMRVSEVFSVALGE